MDLGSRAASSLSEVSGVLSGVVVFDRSRPLLYVWTSLEYRYDRSKQKLSSAPRQSKLGEDRRTR
jgi:hypothetical protein